MDRRLQHETRKVVLLLAAVLLAFVCVPLVCAPNPAWAANDTATITAKVRVFQEYRVSVSGLENEFTYQIVPREDDAPLPVDESGKAFNSFTLTRTDERWLEFAVPVAMDPSASAYAYHYTLKPAKTKLADGLYYVDVLSTSLDAGVNVYYLELYVQPSSKDAALAVVTPLVHVNGWDGPKTTDPGWRVGYKAPAPPGSSSSSSSTGTIDHNPPDPNSPGPSSPISEPTYGSSESSHVGSDDDSSNNSSNNSSNDPATSSATKSATASSSATKSASTSSSTLAKTGDSLVPWSVAACIACAAALLLALACLHRRRAGEDDA